MKWIAAMMMVACVAAQAAGAQNDRSREQVMWECTFRSRIVFDAMYVFNAHGTKQQARMRVQNEVMENPRVDALTAEKKRLAESVANRLIDVIFDGLRGDDEFSYSDMYLRSCQENPDKLIGRNWILP